MSENHATRWLSAAIGLGGAGMEAQASRRLLTLAVAAIEADEGSLLLWDEEIGELRFVATVGNAESEAALHGQRVPLGKGITGLAAATREVQIGAPTYKDIRQTERLSAGPEAVVAAPLIAADRVLGVMTGVSFRTGRRFGSREATVYGEHAAVMAALLDQARRLTAVAALNGEDGPTAAGTAALERQIVERLARLVADRGEALGPLARLLEAIEALLARGRR
ncbi:MAG: GAF domain-containing protein [Stellaceae bacterium]